jgi:exodeoxyribonuclease V beta subunit
MNKAALHFELAETPIEDGTTLIEASAGTGKTYCLAGLVVRLLVERKVDSIGRILVVTFTNAAADELSGRIREAVRHAREALSRPAEGPGEEPYLRALRERFGAAAATPLREALLAFDDLQVATIHGFCKQVLESHAFESGLPFDPELIEDDEALLRSAAEDIWRRKLYAKGREAELLAALAAAGNWTPSTFLEDYRRLHRHPDTRLEPPPDPLGQALADFDRSCQEAAPLLDKAPLRLALSRLRFKDPAAFGAARLEALVEEAGAYFAGELAALPAVGALRRSALRRAIDGGSRQALEAIEFTHECDRLFDQIETVKHAWRAELLAELDRRLAEIKQRDAVFAFDDLLRRLRATLADRQRGDRLVEAVRRRFGVALIDEFQDTDLTQYQIFRRLFRGLPLFLIGDPKQAIYRFRGADVFAYLAAKNEATRTYTLARNWRSEAGLVEAVGRLFGGRRFPFVFQQIDFPEVQAAPATAARRLAGDDGIAFTWHWLDLEESGGEAEAAALAWLAREVAATLSAGLELEDAASGVTRRRPLGAGDLAVLVRTNGEATAVQEALRGRGVPAVVARSGDIFHSEEMAELERLVLAIVDPGHRGRLMAASSTLVFGDDAAALWRLLADDRLWQARVTELEDLRERWRRSGFMAAMQLLLEKRQVRRRLLLLRDGERRLTNWQHAVELVHQEIHQRQLAPSAVAAWLAAERLRARHARDTSELRLESDARAVKIVTVHKSKGLEYEIVFCPFLWRTQRADRLPALAHTGDGEKVVYDFGSRESDKHLLLAEAERLSEDARLLYVALTRARRRCHVLWGRLGQRRRAAATALAYLLHAAQTPLELGHDAVLQAAAGVAGLFDEIEGRADLWLADLERLARRAPGSMAIRRVALETARDVPATAGGGEAALARMLPAELALQLEPWRIASFTSLARGTAALPEIAEYQDPSWPAPRSAVRPAGLFAFARGTRAGTALHELLEQVDFAAPGSDGGRAMLRRVLERHGLAEARQHDGGEGYDPAEAAGALLELVAAGGLPDGQGAFSLAEVDQRQMAIEWEFHLPAGPLSTRGLARVLERFAGELPRGYPERVAGLGDKPVSGFLKGFVDLLFGHRGRHYLIDWKSNHLGNSLADYPPAALELAMVEHHYLLQYLLYTVALHRHLLASLPDYDYDRHVGGVFYLFLRGLELGPPADLFSPPPFRGGLYAARPSRGLIEAVSRAIAGEER